MLFDGHPKNDPKAKQYQLWIFDESRDQKFPVDGGVFDVTADGELIVRFESRLDVSRATLFAITEEVPGGVVVSERTTITATAAPG